MEEVVVPAAEDHVVGVVGVEERRVDLEVPDAAVGPRLYGVRSTVFFSAPRDVDRRLLHLAGRVDELVQDVALDVFVSGSPSRNLSTP